MAVDVTAYVAAEGSAAAVVAIAITAVVIAVADAAHPIVAMVAISVAFVRDEEGKGQKVLVHLAAVVNVDAGGHDYFESAAHHLC